MATLPSVFQEGVNGGSKNHYLGQSFMSLFPSSESFPVEVKFVRTHYEDLKDDWIVTDPLNQVHLLKFNRSFFEPRIVGGVTQMIEYYGLTGIHWGVLSFKGDSEFDIHIWDDDIVPISYAHVPPNMLHVDVGNVFPPEGRVDINNDPGSSYLGFPLLHLNQPRVVGPAFFNFTEPSSHIPLPLAHGNINPYQYPTLGTVDQPNLPLPYVENPFTYYPRREQVGYNFFPLHPGGAPPPVVHAEVIEIDGFPYPALHYEKSLPARLSHYRATGPQMSIRKRVANYLRECGHEYWTLRARCGVTKPVRVLGLDGKSYIKLGKGWNKFCKEAGMKWGDCVILNFTGPVLKFIDVEVVG